MDNRKNTILNIISSLALQVITIVCGFVIPRLLIGSFGSSVYGLTNSISQFLSYIVLLESGFGPVVKSVLYKPIANKDKTTIEKILKYSEGFFRKIALIFIIYIAILCIILPIIVSNEFDAIFTLSLIIIISISTFAEYFLGMTYTLYLQAEQKTYIFKLINISILVLNTIIIILLINLGASIQIIKLVTTLLLTLRPIIQKIYVRKKYNLNLNNTKNEFKIEQKWNGLAQHIAYVINNNTDVVILTLCTNSLEVSVYSIYLLITKSLKNVIVSFTGGVMDSFGDMIAKGENKLLNSRFSLLEDLYYTITTLVFSATFFLILPFVNVYMSGVADVNYIRPVFAYVMVLICFVWSIRNPYEGLTKAAGHFKQTQKGAWLEAIFNIAISFALVWKYGILGVAIGTLTTMIIRTIEFMYHCSKYILNRSFLYTLGRLLLIIVELLIIAFIINSSLQFNINNYIDWVKQAVLVTAICALVIIPINFIAYNKYRGSSH